MSATAAVAFEETRAGGAAAPATSQSPAAPAGPLDLNVPGISVTPPTGTEVRIPGFGKLGILPKLDFGLELLYGVDGKADDRRLLPEQNDDGLGIRGTLKHRF